MGGEKKPLEISELGCADGCGREMDAENCADGNGWGELRGRLRTAWVPGSCWKMGGEKKPLEISELGCADGCGRSMGEEYCADG